MAGNTEIINGYKVSQLPNGSYAVSSQNGGNPVLLTSEQYEAFKNKQLTKDKFQSSVNFKGSEDQRPRNNIFSFLQTTQGKAVAATLTALTIGGLCHKQIGNKLRDWGFLKKAVKAEGEVTKAVENGVEAATPKKNTVGTRTISWDRGPDRQIHYDRYSQEIIGKQQLLDFFNTKNTDEINNTIDEVNARDFKILKRYKDAKFAFAGDEKLVENLTTGLPEEVIEQLKFSEPSNVITTLLSRETEYSPEYLENLYDFLKTQQNHFVLGEVVGNPAEIEKTRTSGLYILNKLKAACRSSNNLEKATEADILMRKEMDNLFDHYFGENFSETKNFNDQTINELNRLKDNLYHTITNIDMGAIKSGEFACGLFPDMLTRCSREYTAAIDDGFRYFYNGNVKTKDELAYIIEQSTRCLDTATTLNSKTIDILGTMNLPADCKHFEYATLIDNYLIRQKKGLDILKQILEKDGRFEITKNQLLADNRKIVRRNGKLVPKIGINEAAVNPTKTSPVIIETTSNEAIKPIQSSMELSKSIEIFKEKVSPDALLVGITQDATKGKTKNWALAFDPNGKLIGIQNQKGHIELEGSKVFTNWSKELKSEIEATRSKLFSSEIKANTTPEITQETNSVNKMRTLVDVQYEPDFSATNFSIEYTADGQLIAIQDPSTGSIFKKGSQEFDQLYAKNKDYIDDSLKLDEKVRLFRENATPEDKLALDFMTYLDYHPQQQTLEYLLSGYEPYSKTTTAQPIQKYYYGEAKNYMIGKNKNYIKDHPNGTTPNHLEYTKILQKILADPVRTNRFNEVGIQLSKKYDEISKAIRDSIVDLPEKLKVNHFNNSTVDAGTTISEKIKSFVSRDLTKKICCFEHPELFTSKGDISLYRVMDPLKDTSIGADIIDTHLGWDLLQKDENGLTLLSFLKSKPEFQFSQTQIKHIEKMEKANRITGPESEVTSNDLCWLGNIFRKKLGLSI